jgi:hypothetical protein
VRHSVARNQWTTSTTSVVHGSAPPLAGQIVVARISRGEENGAAVDHHRHALAQPNRRRKKGALRSVGTKDYRLPRLAAIDGALDALRIEAQFIGIRQRGVPNGGERRTQHRARRWSPRLHHDAPILRLR